MYLAAAAIMTGCSTKATGQKEESVTEDEGFVSQEQVDSLLRSLTETQMSSYSTDGKPESPQFWITANADGLGITFAQATQLEQHYGCVSRLVPVADKPGTYTVAMEDNFNGHVGEPWEGTVTFEKIAPGDSVVMTIDCAGLVGCINQYAPEEPLVYNNMSMTWHIINESACAEADDEALSDEERRKLAYTGSWEGPSEWDDPWRLDLWFDPDKDNACGYFYCASPMYKGLKKPVTMLYYDPEDDSVIFEIPWEGDNVTHCRFKGSISSDGQSLTIKSVRCAIDPECPFCGFTQPVYHKIAG